MKKRRMTAQTLIKRLQKLIDTHGNMPIDIAFEGDSGYINSIFVSKDISGKSEREIVIWCYITNEQFEFNKKRPIIMEFLKNYLNTHPLRRRKKSGQNH